MLKSQISPILTTMGCRGQRYCRTVTRILENTNNFLQDIQMKKAKVNDANPPQVSIEHDSALRGDVRGDNQREYLVELGPFHLARLRCFPANQDIPQGKQNRFTPRWFDEYPHLEYRYSLKKDAVFCFVCSLFDDTHSKEKADPGCISTGVRTLARQALPFRGDSENYGNFYQLVFC